MTDDARALPGDLYFREALERCGAWPLRAAAVSTLQVNLGYRCNLSCIHCHVNGGPSRGEIMDEQTVERVLSVLRASRIPTLDITGGAPELNPFFCRLIDEARRIGAHVIVRTNLTLLVGGGTDHIPRFLGERGVEVTASLPCYSEGNVDGIRGEGTFRKSIEALKGLNALGYGQVGSGLVLNLVYNPAGAWLAPPQALLEADYARELKDRHGVIFNRLFAFSNVPVGRFRERLSAGGELAGYEELLRRAFNPSILEGLMCRRLVSVGWDGRLYDCDFNQTLGKPPDETAPRHLSGFDPARLAGRQIAVGDHCFACAAGQGST